MTSLDSEGTRVYVCVRECACTHTHTIFKSNKYTQPSSEGSRSWSFLLQSRITLSEWSYVSFISNPPIQAVGTAEYGMGEGSEVALGAPEIILRFPTAKISLGMPHVS